jgi:hypothetical protein
MARRATLPAASTRVALGGALSLLQLTETEMEKEEGVEERKA